MRPEQLAQAQFLRGATLSALGAERLADAGQSHSHSRPHTRPNRSKYNQNCYL